MRAGKMTHMLELQRATTTVNAAGTPVQTWQTFTRVRAERVELTAEEYMRAAGASDETSLVFRTWRIDGLTNADRVLYRGQALNLKAIVPLDGRKGTELRCWAIGDDG